MILLIFWNAHSAESREILPILNHFFKKHQLKKIKIVGIVGDPLQKAIKYLQHKSIRFCNFYDVESKVREMCEIDADDEPIFWLVDEEGYVTLRLSGYNKENLHKIKRSLKKAG